MRIANRYEVIKSLGRGGWGKVYLVKDITQSENPPLALKLIPSNISQGELLRLKQEFYLLSHLSHPNILKVFDFGETQKHYYFTMEYIAGKGFNKHFSKRLQKGIEESFYDAIFQLLSALQFIHQKGLVHRDLKPTNILITGENHVKLLDFGFTDSVSGFSGKYDFSEANDIKGFKGTLGYAAPEVLKGERGDLRTDLYSMGVILYEILTHRLPFDGKTPFQIIRYQLEQIPSPPLQINPHISPPISEIVMKLLSREPSNRYSSVEDVYEDLVERYNVEYKNSELKWDFQSPITNHQPQIYTPPLIARERELIQFQNFMKKAKEGTGGVILLSGERGVGKSRLLQEFKFQGQLEEFHVLTGISSDTEKISFYPIRQILRQLPVVGKFPFEPRESEEERLPEEAKKWRIFDEVAGIFHQHSKPLILLIDDFHLSDFSTHDLTAFLVRSLWRRGVIFVVAYESISGEPPETFLKGIRGIDTLRKIHLKNFSVEETTTFLTHLLSIGRGGIASSLQEEGDWIYNQTGGCPLLIEETTKWLIAEGILERRGKRWIFHKELLTDKDTQLNAPTEIVDMITHTLSKLNGLLRNLLEDAAVIGDRFPTHLLKELTLLSDKDFFPLLTYLYKEHLLLRETGAGDLYTFSQNWLREFLYEKLDPKKRRETHQRILRILEKSPPDGNVMFLAQHAIQGEVLEKSLRYGIRAGEQAEKSYNHRGALEIYKKLLPLLKTKRKKLEFLEKIGDLYEKVGDYDESIVHYSHALQIAKGKYTLILLHHKIGTIERKRSHYSEALDSFEKGFSLLKEKNTSEGIKILNGMGWVYREQGDFDKAIDTLTKAEKIAGENKDREGLSLCLQNLSIVYWNQTKYKEAIAVGERALSLAEEIQDDYKKAAAYNYLGFYYGNIGRLEKTRKYFSKSLKIREKIGDIHGIASLHNHFGIIDQDEGNWDDAIRHYEKSFEIFEKLDDQGNIGRLYNNFARIFLDLGKWDRAFEYHNKSLEHARNLGNKRDTAIGYCNLGQSYLDTGDLNQAKETLETSLSLSTEIGYAEGMAVSLVNLAILEKERGELEKATTFLDRAGKIYKERKINWDLSFFLQICSLVYLQRKDIGKALQYAKKGLKLSLDLKAYEDIGSSHRILGMIYAEKGEDEKALENFSKSKEVLENINNRFEQAQTLFEFARFLLSLWQKNYKIDSFRSACTLLKKSEIIFRNLGAKGHLDKVQKLSAQMIEQLSGMSISFGREDQLKALYEASHVINAILDFQTLLRKVLDLVINLLHAERGVLLLRENGNLRVAAGRDIDNTTIQDATKLSKTILRKVSEKGISIISSDALTDTRFKKKESVILNKIHSLLCVPIKFKEKVIGTFYVDSRIMKGLFSTEDLNFLNALSNFLAVVIENARLHEDLRKEATHLKQEIGEKFKIGNIVGKSKAMQKIFNQIEIFSKSDASVLIEGETGTGKELVARAIHYNGPRKEKCFIPVECGALPETLAESELFGHKKGTFTDAKEDKLGLFEVADSGTLFLDQIDNLSLKVQAKLLRVLQDGEIRRLGETKPRRVDVRIIAATTKNLKEEVRQRRFRDDLYYRLNTLSICIPLLRDRIEDLPLLIEHFLYLFSLKTNRKVKGISKKAMNNLLTYSWPGNVRELEHAVERGYTLTEDNGIIELESLLDRDRKDSEEELDLICDEKPLKEAVEILERKKIYKALEIHDWNVTRAAKSLSITREGLRKKINRYKISKMK
jgi:Nif-specific regulatory protein